MLELTQAALPELRRNHGAIVLVSTGAASHAYAGWSAYST
jgi:NAD(P)-dependent dehydrogenase (short-subunit alcohol dehydrogenase family)